MINYTMRYVKRFAVLVPGIVIAYIAAHTIYPLFSKRLSVVFAILFTYIIVAYVLIPAAIRLLRIIIPARHLPLYCVTPDGFASDPINIGIIGTRQQLIGAMKEAGWDIADRHSLKNLLRQVTSTLLRQAYKTAPMSALFLFGRKQDIGFELVRDNKPGHRHHVRFWATTFDKDRQLSVRSIHWLPRELKHHEDDKLLWLGAASRDIGFAFIRHNAQITHMIHPNTDRERDLITRHLISNDAVELPSIRLEYPYRLINRVWLGYLQTDGVLKICKLP